MFDFHLTPTAEPCPQPTPDGAFIVTPDLGLEPALDRFIDQQAARAIGQGRQRAAGHRLTILFVAVIEVDVVEPAVVPQLTDLHAVQDHHVLIPGN